MKPYLGLAILLAASSVGVAADLLETSNILIRDPFILPVAEENAYYMVSSGSAGEGGPGFMLYKSNDLQKWEKPFRIFTPPEGFWATKEFWAPEIHMYKGKYYLFASMKSPNHYRGTQIFASETSTGPYQPISEGPATPEHWECLDGTLYVEDGVPYIVFCHEWCQVRNGTICAQRLSDDLSRRVGNPKYLFCATDAPWVTKRPCKERDYPAYVTDGPCFYKSAKGRLFLLWSSTPNGRYTVGIAESSNGRLDGEWTQHAKPLFSEHGGHCSIFRKFDGTVMLVLHAPNSPGGQERARFFPLLEDADGMISIQQ